MAISYVSGSNTTYASRTNTTVTAPASIADNDVMLATVFYGQSGSYPSDLTAPAGWSTIGTYISLNAGFYARVATYIKVAASESGNYTWTHGSRSTIGQIRVYRGVDTTTPQDATSTSNQGTLGTTRTWTGLTTATNNAWIVALGADWGDFANNLTPPTGMTERLDTTVTYAADQTIATAGATGNRSHTCNSSGTSDGFDHPWGARLVALRPASVGATVTSTGAGTAGAATGTGTAEREIVSNGAATAPSATGAGEATAASEVTSEGATTAPSATGAGTAVRAMDATGAGTAGAATGAGEAVRAMDATGATVLAPATGAGEAVRAGDATGDTTAPSATGAGEAAVTAFGSVSTSGATTAPSATGAGEAVRAMDATGVTTLPGATGAGEAAVPVTVTSEGATTAPSAGGAGLVDSGIAQPDARTGGGGGEIRYARGYQRKWKSKQDREEWERRQMALLEDMLGVLPEEVEEVAEEVIAEVAKEAPKRIPQMAMPPVEIAAPVLAAVKAKFAEIKRRRDIEDDDEEFLTILRMRSERPAARG